MYVNTFSLDFLHNPCSAGRVNIFYLDKDPALAAKYHNDRHCVKMIVESCQLLSNALPKDRAPYRRTHYNHPCSVWVRQSVRHWYWLDALVNNLLLEWGRRYNHATYEIHGCHSKWANMRIKNLLPDNGFTPPPQCMPDDCKCEDTVQAYRNYYMTHKRHLAQWKTQTPEWDG